MGLEEGGKRRVEVDDLGPAIGDHDHGAAAVERGPKARGLEALLEDGGERAGEIADLVRPVLRRHHDLAADGEVIDAAGDTLDRACDIGRHEPADQKQ
jgi:hypothetical protein